MEEVLMLDILKNEIEEFVNTKTNMELLENDDPVDAKAYNENRKDQKGYRKARMSTNQILL